MTFLHKLAKWLALIPICETGLSSLCAVHRNKFRRFSRRSPRYAIACLTLTHLAAGSKQQFTAVALMGDGSRMFPTVSWTATGGTISPSGLFTASGTPGGYTVNAIIGDGAILGWTAGIVDPPVLTGFAIEPEALMLESGAVRQFMPYASWSDGANTVPALSWSATGGAITLSGIFTPGNTPGTHRVIASSALHGKADTSDVTILPRIVGIRVAPLTALLALGATLVVKAEALRSDGTDGPVAVQWSAQGGSISLNGTFAAGSTPGNYTVVGTLTALNGQVFSDTAHFQVGAGAATLVQLFVRSDMSVVAGTTAQFSVTGAWSDGSSAVPAVTWSATGGLIDAAGLYTAASVPGTFKVIATQQNGSKADTADVVVTAAPILTISAFTVSPQTDILGAGQTRQFSTTLSWSDGLVHPADISWVSAGGTIFHKHVSSARTIAGGFPTRGRRKRGQRSKDRVSSEETFSAEAAAPQEALGKSSTGYLPGDTDPQIAIRRIFWMITSAAFGQFAWVAWGAHGLKWVIWLAVGLLCGVLWLLRWVLGPPRVVRRILPEGNRRSRHDRSFEGLFFGMAVIRNGPRFPRLVAHHPMRRASDRYMCLDLTFRRFLLRLDWPLTSRVRSD